MMQGVNDAVVMALLQKGLPNTAENYNRMADALRMGGHTGNSAQPVTKQMQEMARGYAPTGSEDEAEAVDNISEEADEDLLYLESMDEMRGSPQKSPTPSRPGAGAKGAASPGGVAASGGETTMQSFPYSPMPGPEAITPMPEEGGMSMDPSIAGLGATGALGVILKNLYDNDTAAEQMRAPKPTGAKMLALPAPQKQLPAPMKQITDQRPVPPEAAPASAAPKVIEGQKPRVRVKAEGKIPNQSPMNEMEGSTSQEKSAAPEKKSNASKAKAAAQLAAEKKAARTGARRLR